ncbi:hypothetical protein DL771_000518 [Monosporascus sp. 5C6A]|nr:hypothetical protein DL771_000518 [Monosporascus sp. 5C6A]
MPSCVAPGDYLMRVELLALHSAYSPGGAQFYMRCAQIRVTGSETNKGTSFVSFPGAYSANDPGITISIHNNNGNPNNGGKPYAIPGPRPLTFRHEYEPEARRRHGYKAWRINDLEHLHSNFMRIIEQTTAVYHIVY